MSAGEALHGLACPNCGGMVPIPEGQAIVQCPFCELRSLVRGERGLLRYQVPQRVDREQSQLALRRFLTGNLAIARDAARQGRLVEAFVAYLPFWSVWTRTLGWVFGEEQVGSGDDRRYEPREVKIAEEMVWTAAACDVGEFGVQEISLHGRPLEPFEPESLHANGMVFEPLGSRSEAEQQASESFQARVRELANLDRVEQVFVRTVGRRIGLVYYPLWVLRYLYRGRAFQVVVDGHSGEVLYGKAPGNTLYRAAALVGGMALGAFLMVDVSALIIYFGLRGDDGDVLWFIAGSLTAGFLLMRAAYRRFRYGEQFEQRGPGKRRRRTVRKGERGVVRAREVKS